MTAPPRQIYLQHFYCWQQSVTQRARVGGCSTPHPFCALNSLYESASYTLLNFNTLVTLLDRVSIPMLTRTQSSWFLCGPSVPEHFPPHHKGYSTNLSASLGEGENFVATATLVQNVGL
ncbi:hypothetical protein AMECASPLE_027709 [Ameca splendens]|uniref:Uncharacterized protein n=1 Tax=Ameca splendens TaxID=208324 RepID=A0ABV0XIB1_9TELE